MTFEGSTVLVPFDSELFQNEERSYDERVLAIVGRYALMYPNQQLYFPKEETIINDQNKKIVVDVERIDQVLDTLISALANNSYPYNLESTVLPQDHQHLPKNLEIGSKQHAMFLFTSCYYMRGGNKSVDAFKGLARLYTSNPEVFDPRIAKDLDPDSLVPMLKQSGLGYHSVVPRQWVMNANTLCQHYDGNPINIYNGVTDYQTCVDRIIKKGDNPGFKGFREKMVSMLTYYLMDEDMIPYFDFPPPVDLHLMRVSIANELVRFEGYAEHDNLLSPELLSTMREYFYNYAVKKKINVLRLADAVWLLSQSLCGNQPGNITLEPFGRTSRKTRSAFLLAKPVSIDNNSQREAYRKTCGSCPIESTCEWNVPGKYYFMQDRLFRRNKRIRFPLAEKPDTTMQSLPIGGLD